MNLGAILRSSYYLGVDRVLTCPEYQTAALTATVSKASSGVLEVFAPYSVNSGVEDFLSRKAESGWRLVGADVSPNSDSEATGFDQPTILIMGGEGSGIPDPLKSLCSSFVNLPPGRRKLHPDVDSLNVSVAAALVINKLMMAKKSK
jgi:21S rRNA (GM2251-2'-O)-methyltransferase